ncbi:hypothetical protein ABZX77_17175 [Streptomyces sp. NPDC004237]|uniref:hypothetical protein n=1 Tax=Streptomyces sp. NPDC004237 TaxID=3154455 RepID=UPI0033BB465B
MQVNKIGGSAQLTGLTVQARDVFGGVHHHAPAAHLPPPRQLPPPIRHFTDRDKDRRLLDDARASGACLFVISGIGGVGKSTLAAQWLSQQGHEEGQFYADLSGPLEPVATATVLRRWLRAVGLDRQPADLAELTGLWRSVTAARTVAVLIDGAGDPAQIRPLLPAGAASSTVVTSRSALRDLAIDGAVLHPLKALPLPAAVQLLIRMAGDHPLASTPEAAALLAEACHRLPLPLVLAGARLAARPQHSVNAVAGALTRSSSAPAPANPEDPIRMLTNAALDETYQDLEAEQQGIYRALGLLPVTDVDPDMVAAVCQMSRGHAEWGLEILDEQQLLEPLPQQGPRVRYRLLPAAREHARALAVRHDPDRDRLLVLRRLCEWILAISTHAQFRLTPAQATLRRSLTSAEPAATAPFEDDAGALAWLESLEVSLLDVLGAAEAAGWDDLVWQLVDSFWPLFLRRHPYELWISAHEIGLGAARRAGNAAAVRQMLASGAIGLSSARRLDEAINWYLLALEAALKQHDVRDEGQALLGLGSCHHDAGHPGRALAFLGRAITVWEECGYHRGVALATIVVGEIALADEPGRALDLFVRARTMLLEADDLYDAARALVMQGHARVVTGDGAAGIREMEIALGKLADAGSTRWQARALELLGQAHQGQGSVDAARACYQRAGQLYDVMRPDDAARVRAVAAAL